MNILSLGLYGGPLTSSIVADLLDVSIENASTCLKRYNRMGLFTRDWVDGYYVYHITEQGEERFWYLVNELRSPVQRADG